MDLKKKKRHGAGRVAFLARQAVIKERLDAGYTMSSIYEDYQEHLGISYSQFTNYVNKYIKEKSSAPTQGEKTYGTRNEEAATAKQPEARRLPSVHSPATASPTIDDEDDLEGKANNSDFF